MTDKELKAARILLKDAAAKRARLEWRTKLGDSAALSSRQLTQEIINNGNEESLRSLAKYFDVHIIPRAVKKDTTFVTTNKNMLGHTVAVMIEKA
jgi:hypothetical protein